MSSITHIAQEANVAVSTVSLVLNKPHKVSDATRHRVQEAIVRLGYRPRQRKRQCRVAAAYSRTLKIDDRLTIYCERWLEGIREAFSHQGAVLNIFPVERTIEEDPLFQKSLEKREFDGLLAMGLREDRGYIEATLERGIPVVALNRRPIHSEFSCVGIDYHGAGCLAARYFMEQGHRKIAVDFVNRGRRSILDLREGFIDTIAHAGLDAPIDWISPLELEDTLGIAESAQRLMHSGATACFCGTPVARAVANYLIGEGVKVPDEMSMMGLENLQYTTSTGLRLSCVDYNARAVGLMGGQLLQQLLTMRGELKHLEATVPARLVKGQTVAPPSIRQ